MERRQVIGISVGPVMAMGLAMLASSWAPAAEAYAWSLRLGAALAAGVSAGVWFCLLLTTEKPREGTAPESDVVKQRGAAVATVIAPSVDLARNTVHFGQVFGSAHFKPEEEFEYRGHRLRKVTHIMASESDGRPMFMGLECEIILSAKR